MHARSSLSFASTLIPSVVAFLLLGCPTDDPVPREDSSSGDVPISTTGAPLCVPDQQRSCTCEAGPYGVQTCLPEGSGFGPCMCEPTPLDTTTGMVDVDSGTTDITASTTDTTSTDTGDSTSTTGEPSVCDEYVPPPELECDLWRQDCPAGEKCMPWGNNGGLWNDTRCSPLAAGAGQVGEACTVQGSSTSGIDDCELGAMCRNVDPDTNMGVCAELCNGCPDDAHCETPGHVCTITNSGALPLCRQICDPLLQDCPAGEACYFVASSAFLCAIDASGTGGEYGDWCGTFNMCDPGLLCRDEATVPGGCDNELCCSELCDITDPAGDAQCSGQADGQSCQPWYAEGTAPAGYEDVGICTL